MWRGQRSAVGLVMSSVLGVGLLGTDPVPERAEASWSAAAAAPVSRTSERPNIVFFLTDDMSTQHLRHMPNTRRLLFRQGARFSNFYASIPLCCPSRASILTGKYAHNTGVVGNSFRGGFQGFHTGDETSNTFAVALQQQAGYDTSLMGKYLNGYPFMSPSSPDHAVDPTYVPPGWSDWAVPIRGAFIGRNYDLNLNGRIVHKQGRLNYLGDYLNERTLTKIRRNHDGEGLALFLSFFGPHTPMPASPVEHRNRRLKRRLSRIGVPRTPDFNERDVSDKPAYIRDLPRIGRSARDELDVAFRRQVLSVTSIDRYVGMVVGALERTGQLDNTYLVFTSDHGYHMGAHRLEAGKNSPYLTDVRVPFAIRGPGIEPGTEVEQVTANIDLAPTFAEMAGTQLPYVHDGESLLTLARGHVPAEWRRYLFVQRGETSTYASSARSLNEPATEAEQSTEELIPRYRAVVSSHHTYVLHRTGEEELYDIREDPYQLDNLLAVPPDGRRVEHRRTHAEVQEALERLVGCVGVEACRVG